MKQKYTRSETERERDTSCLACPRLNARRQHHRLTFFARVKKEAMIDEMMAKNRAQYTQRCVSSRLRESVLSAKERFGSSLYFRAIDRSPMSHIIFFPSHRPLFLSREEKRTKRFETRANERVDLQKQHIFVVVCCRLLLPSVVSSSSFERARIRSTLDTLRVSRSVFC